MTTSPPSSTSIGIGSLVGGVLPVPCDQATDRALAAAEEFRARKSVERDSGVLGFISGEEDERFDLYFALDALEKEGLEVLTAGVFGVAFEAEPTAGPFEKKDVRLFCFKESVDVVSLADIVTDSW
jgi:hypothetical protein